MSDFAPLHHALIGWFEANKEDLPWRSTSDPYAIWVSEIMLQQTQVATVIGYYERFLAQFPTVKALAASPLDAVLKVWEGLGYYSRARNLHKAAQVIMDKHGGALPARVEELQRLPGIGRYTAGAIASLAFGQNIPVLDGNVIRIFTRLFNIPDDVGTAAVKEDLWAQAAWILPTGHAAAWNEGLMELGRRICSPRSPRCETCPLAAHCEAFRLNLQHERPVKTRRGPTPHYDVTAAVIHHPDERILITQRPADGMLGGLWEFPGGKREAGETLAECLTREIQEELGIEIAVGQQIATIRHAYTHFRITLYAYRCQWISGEPRALGCAGFVWTTLDDLVNYAFPVTDQQIITALRGGGGQTALDLGI
jgi:A/G-specific adenine glycosylase